MPHDIFDLVEQPHGETKAELVTTPIGEAVAVTATAGREEDGHAVERDPPVVPDLLVQDHVFLPHRVGQREGQ